MMLSTQTVFIFVATAMAAGIISVSALTAQFGQGQQMSSTSEGGFASINTEISDNTIVITITRGDEGEEDAVPLPPGPIVIIPPNATSPDDENATVILPPAENVTGPGNITIIEPDGNVTQVPAGNITQTPGNVTVIDPPAIPEPEPCGCPPVTEEVPAPGVPANETEIVPGGPTTLPVESNDTTIVTNETTVVRPDTEPGEESGNGGNGE